MVVARQVLCGCGKAGQVDLQSVPAGICGNNLENLRKKLRQKVTKNATKSAE